MSACVHVCVCMCVCVCVCEGVRAPQFCCTAFWFYNLGVQPTNHAKRTTIFLRTFIVYCVFVCDCFRIHVYECVRTCVLCVCAYVLLRACTNYITAHHNCRVARH